jgi:hypothetical protein
LNMNKFSIFFLSICISFFINWMLIQLLNLIDFNLIYPISSFKFYSTNSCMQIISFHIFIWTKLNFHKINSCPFINWWIDCQLQ